MGEKKFDVVAEFRLGVAVPLTMEEANVIMGMPPEEAAGMLHGAMVRRGFLAGTDSYIPAEWMVKLAEPVEKVFGDWLVGEELNNDDIELRFTPFRCKAGKCIPDKTRED